MWQQRSNHNSNISRWRPTQSVQLVNIRVQIANAFLFHNFVTTLMIAAIAVMSRDFVRVSINGKKSGKVKENFLAHLIELVRVF